MKTIKKIAPSSRNGDISALLTLILGALGIKDWSVDAFLTSIIGKLSTFNTNMMEALNRLKVYSQLANKDHVRDMAVRGLFKLVEGYTYILIAEMQEAALVINNVLQQYGLNIQQEDYGEESADIESMLNDLADTNVVASIAKLPGVAEAIAALDAAQKDFETLAVQQAESEAIRGNLDSASTIKQESIAEVNNNLVGYMNTMAKVNPDTYATTADTIAKLIEKNNEVVKRRRTTGEENTTTN